MSKLLTVLLALTSIHASAWDKIVDCNSGELVIDKRSNEPLTGPSYQIVLRGQPLHYFSQ